MNLEFQTGDICEKAVRDYLRTHPVVCERYAHLKKELANRYPYDIEGYCDGKEEFVQRLEKEALKWRNIKKRASAIEGLGDSYERGMFNL